MNGSQSASYVASAFKIMQDQHLSDPLLMAMDHEDTINEEVRVDAISQVVDPKDYALLHSYTDINIDITDAKEGDVIHFPGGAALMGKPINLEAMDFAVKGSAIVAAEKGVECRVIDMDDLPTFDEVRAEIRIGQDSIDKRLTVEGQRMMGAAGHVLHALQQMRLPTPTAEHEDSQEPQSSGREVIDLPDRWASLIKDAMPEDQRPPRSTERFRSEMEPVIMLPIQTDDSAEAHWEPAKHWVAANVHRKAPEGFELGPAALEASQKELETPVTPMARHSIMDIAVLDWLAVVNELPAEVSAEEITSAAGRLMLRAIRDSLWFTVGTGHGIRSEVADELESHGYLVSYTRNTGLLMLQLKSGAITWVVK